VSGVATVSVLCRDQRLWSADGITATLTGVDDRGLLALVDGEQQPVPVQLGSWRLALACDRCDRPAELAARNDDSAELLCNGCGHSWASGPAAWANPIPRMLIRELYMRCHGLT
jgi:hypothetical protein